MHIDAQQLAQYVVGSGQWEAMQDGQRLRNGITTATEYTNAQIDDYQGLRRPDFLHQPPLTMTLNARFSHSADQLRGTAGFGFWNDPFGMTGTRLPTLPRALWFFFSSPPSNMALALDVPGPGWKAATIDAWRWSFFLLAPTAPLAIPLMNLQPFYRRLWPIGQRAIGVHEQLLPLDITNWHHYKIDWQRQHTRFWIDDQLVLHAEQSPRGPLGLVIWKDNQAMQVTPWGFPYHQLVTCHEQQWMEVTDLTIE